MRARIVAVVVAMLFVAAVAVCQEETSTYASASDLAASLTNISQTAVTRDNHVSLFLTQLQLAPLDPPPAGADPIRYALVVDVNLIPDAGEKGETYSYVLDQPVEQTANASAIANLAAAFRTIFSNRPLKAFREIQIEVHLIRLDGEERERFAKVAGLFGSVVQKSMFGPLVGVLGIMPDAGQSSKVLAFDGRFLIPTNYWAHQNARRNGFPTISNDEAIALAFQVASPKNNTNVVSFLKNTANKISQVVVGKSVVKNVDNVQGVAVFTFTKNQFSPVPRSLSDSLMQIKSGVESTDLPADFDGWMGNTSFLFKNLEPDLPPAGRESVATFLELAKLYRDYRSIDEADAPDALATKKLLNRFQAWLTQSGVRLQQQSQSGPRVQGVYTASSAGDLYPVIIYPYGLTDPLIVSAVLWQLKLHEFVAAQAATDPNVKLAKYTFKVNVATSSAKTGA